jgi:mannose-6-phosphate isomerase-like protein (cupin superfamily)
VLSRPLVSLPGPGESEPPGPLAATGGSFSVMEWRDSGPRKLHIHHADDEAWHVLEGTLRFRFADGEVDVPAGGTVYVPAGVPHTYRAIDACYLIVLTPRLAALIAELQGAPEGTDYASLYRRYQSTLIE